MLNYPVRIILNILFLVVSVFGSGITYSQGQQVLIRIIQEESSLLSDFQTNLLLERKPFKFQILLKDVEGIYVFASIRDSVYRFTETSVIQDFAYLKLLELRDEDVYNTNKELNISETGWSYWFYKPEPALHAYNRKVVRLDSSRIVCTKAIRQLFDIADTRVIKLRDIKTPLYLFFVAVAEYDSNGKPLRELMRRKVKIEWVDEL
jgi:hypothetical protein